MVPEFASLVWNYKYLIKDTHLVYQASYLLFSVIHFFLLFVSRTAVWIKMAKVPTVKLQCLADGIKESGSLLLVDIGGEFFGV